MLMLVRPTLVEVSNTSLHAEGQRRDIEEMVRMRKVKASQVNKRRDNEGLRVLK